MGNSLERKYMTRECITTRNFLYHFIDTGPSTGPAGPTTLLLHGHGDYSFGWRDVIPVLYAKGMRCIAPDLLGFGKTSKPVEKEAYRAKSMCRDMLELLASAGIQKDQKVLVVGHDWGTHLASRLTLHYPEKILSIVTMAAPYMPPLPQPTSLDEFTTTLPNFSYWKFFVSKSFPILLRNNLPLFWKAVVCAGNETPIPMSDLEGFLSAVRAKDESVERPALWDQATYEAYTSTYIRGGWEAPMNWYKAFFDNFEDEKQFLEGRFEHPMLMIAGENDPAVPVGVIKMSEKFLAKPTVLSLQCGHWVLQETGAELAQAIVEWLQSNGGFTGT
ncbi:Alpha/Beta hydrolase protein [Rhexocercosporidium sp. MPI-PUGE-AT-0058]|nr:Alpha/Beta hydrolase protein [Rhexocercosporidium sp. MPI-PUGE-AT-0058]